MRNVLTLLLGLVVAVGLIGCDNNGGTEGPRADVRFMHASADAGPLTLVVDGETVESEVAFSGEIDDPTVSEYHEVPIDSEAEIEVQGAEGNTILTTSAGEANLEEDANYTIILAGALAAEADTPQPIVLRDRFDTDLGEDQVGIRIVHGSAGAGAVDVYLTPPGTNLQNVQPLVSDFQFTDDSPGGFAGQFAPQDVTQDGSELSVTPAGQKEPILLQRQVGGDQGVQVSPGQFITGVAIDGPQGEPGALIHVDMPDQ